VGKLVGDLVRDFLQSEPMIRLELRVMMRLDRLLRYIVEPFDFFLSSAGSFLDAYMIH